MQYKSKTAGRCLVVNHKHYDYANTALTLVIDITTTPYAGRIRVVENEYMLLLLVSANVVFLSREKNTNFLLFNRLEGNNNIIFC